MKRTVDNVFRELNKKGMTRAFIETDNGEYIYPPVNQNKNLLQSSHRKIFLSIVSIAIAVALLWLNPFTAREGESRITRNKAPRDKDGMTLLHHAVIRSDSQAVALLLRNGSPIDAPDNYGWTALMWAVFNNDVSMCRLLSEKNASIKPVSIRPWFKFPAGATAVDIAETIDNKAILPMLQQAESNKE